MGAMRFLVTTSLAAVCAIGGARQLEAQTVRDSNLIVRTVATGLRLPSTMVFIGPSDILVTEKNSGKVQRVVNGVITGEVLDLPVNFASERGLLGITLHPNFGANNRVYLYWTESTTGADSDQLGDTSPLGNRVDRFVWNAASATLTFEMTIIRLRALQADAGQPARGNHNGGVIKFGPDGKLYIYMGDNGRRGQLQNLPDGPGCNTSPCPTTPTGNLADDQFGGPEPDNAHLTGVILRLNDDGTTPSDNPFFTAGALRGGEAGANLQKVFAYGIRNGFGMDFDPRSGSLWEAQNGDDSFTELNLVAPGTNLGWVQIMGPLQRLAQFKAIETSLETDPVTNSQYFGLQQVRWSPVNIADTAQEALARLFTIFEGGNAFGADLVGAQEVPAVNTTAGATAAFQLAGNTLSYELRATAPITNARQAHIHLGARGQNGPIAAFLFNMPAGQSFQAGDLIASGTLTDAQVSDLPRFEGTVAGLAERLRQGRGYVNLHTAANPGGEVRGQIVVTDKKPVSRYSDPQFSWKFEIAPAAIGFIRGPALGPQYDGRLVVGAARTFLDDGHLFLMKLTGNRRAVAVDDPRLADRVADNLNKFDPTESEELLFGSGFGVITDIQTGPNGNLFLVSLSSGAIYEIARK